MDQPAFEVPEVGEFGKLVLQIIREKNYPIDFLALFRKEMKHVGLKDDLLGRDLDCSLEEIVEDVKASRFERSNKKIGKARKAGDKERVDLLMQHRQAYQAFFSDICNYLYHKYC